MRGRRFLFYSFLLLALGACTQAPPSSRPDPTLKASLTPREVEVVGEGEARLTLQLEAAGLQGPLRLSLAPEVGLALSPGEVPAQSGAYPLTLRTPRPLADATLDLTLTVAGGGKRVDLPLRVRHLLPLWAGFVNPPPVLAVPQGGELALSLEVRPRKALGQNLRLTTDQPWLTAVPGASLPPGGGVVPVRLRAAPNAPLGERTALLTVELGGERQTLTLTLRVDPPPPTPPAPDFSLALSPASLTLAPGGEGQVGVAVLRQGGFAGEVALVLEGSPLLAPWDGAGPDRVAWRLEGTGDSRTLRLKVGSSVPAGELSLRVRGTSGSLVREAPLALRVESAPPPPPPGPSPDFTLSLSPDALAVIQGQTGLVDLTLTPEGGFTGEVSLSLVGAPQGVSLSPTALQVNGPTSITRTLTLSVASSTPIGPYNLKVRAQAGSLTREASLKLQVTAPPTPPPPPPANRGFTLSLSPEDPALLPGEAGRLTLTLTPQGGFTGQVSLSLVGAPQGVSLSPAQVSLTGSGPQTFTLTLAAAQGVPTGAYPLTLRAQGDGAQAEASFRLSVYALRLEEVEWAQTVVLPTRQWREWGIPALAGKEALVRVHLAADPAPVRVEAPLTGRVEVGPTGGAARFSADLSFTCPERLPQAADRDDLNTTCRALIPANLFPESLFGPGERLLEMRLVLRAKDGQERREVLPLHRPFYISVVVVPAAVDAIDPSREPLHLVPPDPARVQEVAQRLSATLSQYFHVSGARVRVRAPATYRDYTVEPFGAAIMARDLNLQENGREAIRHVYLALTPVSSSVLGVGGVHYEGNGPFTPNNPEAVPVRFASASMGSRESDGSIWPWPVGSILNLIAHEIGHALGLLHARGCGAYADVDPDYPRPDGRTEVPNFLRGTFIPTGEVADIMSYCASRDGISAYHYRKSYRPPNWNQAHPHGGLESMMQAEP